MDIAARSDDPALLAEWDMPIGDLFEFTERVASHPRFTDAARILGRNMLALAASDRALDGVFKDAGRYVTAMLAMHLDLTGGLTLPTRKDVCVRSGFLSPGRAGALLTYMLYLGYMELLPAMRRGVPARYILTPRFVDGWRRHLVAGLRAAELIEPAAGLVRRAFYRPQVCDTYVRLQSETLFQAAREAQRASAFLEVFLHRHAGTQVVHTLVMAAPPGDFLAGAP